MHMYVIFVNYLYFRAPKKLLKLCHNDYDDDDSYSVSKCVHILISLNVTY